MEKKEKKSKIKINKSKIVVRVMAGFLAFIMVVTTFSSLVYYLVD